MWCKECNRETETEICELCGTATEPDVPLEMHWCGECKVPVVMCANDISKDICPSCHQTISYLCADLRPVFPEERLLLEILKGKPLAFLGKSVWASNNRYYIDGKPVVVTTQAYRKMSISAIQEKLEQYAPQNNSDFFDSSIKKFVAVNRSRLAYIVDEAHAFIKEVATSYPRECVVISFSGGKDSTVTADLTTKALGDPSLVHIFGNTTLEFPLTLEYVERYRRANPKAIIKSAINREQEFYKVCEDIGPPARMLRWCCSMFKTGPITRVLNSMYRDKDILTFYGIVIQHKKQTSRAQRAICNES